MAISIGHTFQDPEKDGRLTGDDFGHFVVVLADFDGNLNVEDGKRDHPERLA